MATYLTRTPSSGSHGTTWTISFWFKNTCSNEANEQYIYMGGDNTTTNNLWIRLQGTDRTLYLRNRSGGVNNTLLITNRKFRDTSAWYHIVYVFDGSNATEGDRVRLYVNGVRETSFSSETYPSQGTGFYIGATGDSMDIGRRTDGSGYNDMNLLLAHYHIIDGTAYNADTFGSTDSTTGIWKPKTAPSVTYGTNGFFLKFENSASMGTDSSGNSNNFTVNGTMTQTIDTPSNVFATLNFLDNYYSGFSFSNGNNTVALDNISERYVMGNLGVSSGKWYWEGKLVSSSGFTYSKIGIEGSEMKNTTNGYQADSYGYRGENGGKKVNNGTFTNWGDSYTNGDIIGVAVDLDNNNIYFSKNGTWQESGDPTSGSSGTGAAFSLTTPSTGFYYPAIGKEDADTCTWSFNFGNGYFGTTAVSSAQNPDDGIGIFEYDVPAGYRALCTKSINAQEYD